jgi:hypothetical protein
MIPLAALAALLIPFMILGVVVVVIVLIFRSVARSGANVTPGVPRPPVNAPIQVGPDGFWLSSFEPGSVIYYQYWMGGMKRQGQSVFRPGNGRQFIYTGMQPNNVEIVRVVDQSGSVVTGPDYFDDDTPDMVPPIIGAAAGQVIADALANAQPEPPAPPPPRQFPSAY